MYSSLLKITEIDILYINSLENVYTQNLSDI